MLLLGTKHLTILIAIKLTDRLLCLEHSRNHYIYVHNIHQLNQQLQVWNLSLRLSLVSFPLSSTVAKLRRTPRHVCTYTRGIQLHKRACLLPTWMTYQRFWSPNTTISTYIHLDCSCCFLCADVHEKVDIWAITAVPNGPTPVYWHSHKCY